MIQTAIAPFSAFSSIGEQLQNSQFRSVDAQIRQELSQARMQAGSEGTVTAQVTYSIGRDGQLYATGSTVTTTTRSNTGAVQRGASNPSNIENSNASEKIVLPLQQKTMIPQSLSDIKTAQLNMSPIEFAQAFSEEFNDDIRRNKLNIIDSGVRSQENLHFRAAGGLVSGLPQYGGTQIGPDGELFATSGHVNIQSPATYDSRKAARDATTLGIAATAPGDASAQDIAVARSSFSKAASLLQQAQDSMMSNPAMSSVTGNNQHQPHDIHA